MQNLLREAKEPGPFSRNLFEPGHFTASAFVLSPSRAELLLILHRRLGLWLQPGGHVEASDVSLLAAAEREVREETGVAQPQLLVPYFDLDIHEIPATASTPAHLHFDVRALFLAHDLLLAPASEVADARWFRLEALMDRDGELTAGFRTDASVSRVAARLLDSSQEGYR